MQTAKYISKKAERIDDDILLERLKKEWKKIEARERRREVLGIMKSGSIEAARYLLAGAAVCGILAVAVVAPNIFSAFGKMGVHRRFYKKNNFNKAFKNLRERNLIKIIKKDNGKIYFQTTSKAKKELLNFCYKEMKIARPEKWDGLWRIVIFDIPKKLDYVRDALRRKLKELEFYQLQKSTFMCPFECEDEINFLKDLYEAEDYIKLIKAVHIDGADILKEKFKI